MSTDTKPTCKLCGGPIRRGNKYGICRLTLKCTAARRKAHYKANKDKIAAYRAANKNKIAAYRAANKDKMAAQGRAYREANRDRVAANKKAYRAANKDKTAARMRAYREANKDKMAAQGRAYREANKDKMAAQGRAYREANKDKMAAQRKAGYEVHKERINNSLKLQRLCRGAQPRHMRYGHRHPCWRGGREVFCAICGDAAGWRLPLQIKKNKTGFRCKKHQRVYLLRKDETHDGSDDPQVRQAVA